MLGGSRSVVFKDNTDPNIICPDDYELENTDRKIPVSTGGFNEVEYYFTPPERKVAKEFAQYFFYQSPMTLSPVTLQQALGADAKVLDSQW